MRNKNFGDSNPFIFLVIQVIKSYAAFSSAVYLALIGVAVFKWFMTGTFHFEFRDKLIFCLTESMLFGVLYGIGGVIMQKARKFEEDKKNNRSKF